MDIAFIISILSVILLGIAALLMFTALGQAVVNRDFLVAATVLITTSLLLRLSAILINQFKKKSCKDIPADG